VTFFLYSSSWLPDKKLLCPNVGCMCSLKHDPYVIHVLTTYTIYCVAVHVGWLGVFFTLNLSFLTNDLMNILLQGYEKIEEIEFKEMK
jgi:DnaJ homolog subfamily C member 14